jgi:hypothetical protein
MMWNLNRFYRGATTQNLLRDAKTQLEQRAKHKPTNMDDHVRYCVGSFEASEKLPHTKYLTLALEAATHMVCSGPDTEGVKAGWKMLEAEFAKALEKGGENVDEVRAYLNRAMLTKVSDAMREATAQNTGAIEITSGKNAWGTPKTPQSNPASSGSAPKTAPTGTKPKGTPFSAHAAMVNNQALTTKPFHEFTNVRGKIVTTTVKALFPAGKEINRSDDVYVMIGVASQNTSYPAFYTALKVVCAECKKADVDGKKDATSHKPKCYVRDQCQNCKLWGHSTSRCLHPTA